MFSPVSVRFRFASFTNSLTFGQLFAGGFIFTVKLPITSFTASFVILNLYRFSLTFLGRFFVFSSLTSLLIRSVTSRFLFTRRSSLPLAFLRFVLFARITGT